MKKTNNITSVVKTILIVLSRLFVIYIHYIKLPDFVVTACKKVYYLFNLFKKKYHYIIAIFTVNTSKVYVNNFMCMVFNCL